MRGVGRKRQFLGRTQAIMQGISGRCCEWSTCVEWSKVHKCRSGKWTEKHSRGRAFRAQYKVLGGTSGPRVQESKLLSPLLDAAGRRDTLSSTSDAPMTPRKKARTGRP